MLDRNNDVRGKMINIHIQFNKFKLIRIIDNNFTLNRTDVYGWNVKKQINKLLLRYY